MNEADDEVILLSPSPHPRRLPQSGGSTSDGKRRPQVDTRDHKSERQEPILLFEDSSQEDEPLTPVLDRSVLSNTFLNVATDHSGARQQHTAVLGRSTVVPLALLKRKAKALDTLDSSSRELLPSQPTRQHEESNIRDIAVVADEGLEEAPRALLLASQMFDTRLHHHADECEVERSQAAEIGTLINAPTSTGTQRFLDSAKKHGHSANKSGWMSSHTSAELLPTSRSIAEGSTGDEGLAGVAALTNHIVARVSKDEAQIMEVEHADMDDACHALQPTGAVDVSPQSVSGGTPSASAMARLWCPWSSMREAPWELSGWGIPKSICDAYREAGNVRRLFPWQRACLYDYFCALATLYQPAPCSSIPHNGGSRSSQGPRSFSGNLLYSAPTSGGKTLVAEMIMLRRLLAMGDGKKALFIVPYVSIAEEKAATLGEMVKSTGKRVRCHAGNKGQRSLGDDIMVCTPEKANILVNIMIEKKRIDELCVVVIDEVHLVGESNGGGGAAGGGRGYLLEVLITKLVLLSRESAGQLIVVALSATLRNAEQLAQWMNGAHLFITDFRPVPLQEYCVCQTDVFNQAGGKVRALATPQDITRSVTQPYVLLAAEAAAADAQVLLFCPSRLQCERVAQEVSTHTWRTEMSLAPRLAQAATHRTVLRRKLLTLRSESATIASAGAKEPTSLADFIELGVAFHHAALSMEEREAIEYGFRQGCIWALCCTTTLATGVNLPARRVIFTAPRIANQMLDAARYKQAAGRAGRMGLDSHGEAFLCCRPQEKTWCLSLISMALPPVASNFASEKRGMMRMLLEGICTKSIQRVEDIERTIRQTLLAVTCDYSVVFTSAKQALEFLELHHFIAWDAEQEVFRTTLLGDATMASALAPDEALLLYQGLEPQRHHFVLSHDLHVVFYCTPFFHGIEPDWDFLLQLVLELPAHAQAVCSHIGVSEGFLVRCSRAPPPRHTMTEETIIHRRLYGALILLDAIREVPLSDVAAKFKLPRQELQKLMETSSAFASMAAAFCERLNWWYFPPLFQHMASRMHRGVEPDLLPLMQIPGLVPWRARELFKRGFKTVLSIASAQPRELETVMSIKAPFETFNADEALIEVIPDPNHPQQGNQNNVKILVARLQKGARVALLEEVATLKESISELQSSAVLPDGDIMSTRKREREAYDAGTVAADQQGDGAAAHKKDSIDWTWLDPSTSSEDWQAWCTKLRAADSIAITCVTPLRDSHPLLMLYVVPRRSASIDDDKEAVATKPYLVVVDDGCAKQYESTPLRKSIEVTEAKRSHRSMRLVTEVLLPERSVSKIIFGAKQWFTELLDGSWLYLASTLVHTAASVEDPTIAEWLLAPEDRSTCGRLLPLESLMESLGLRDPEAEVELSAVDDRVAARAAAVAIILFSAFGSGSGGGGSRSSTTLPHLGSSLVGPLRKAAFQAIRAFAVMQRFRQRLEEAELLKWFHTIEMPIAVVIAQMEHHGVAFDADVYQTKAKAMRLKAQLLQQEAYAITGRSNWSLTSPKDCSTMLFDVLKLPCLERTFDTKYLPNRGGRKRRDRIAKESRSSKASVLHALSRMFPECKLPAVIGEHRTMHGWLEKYMDPLLCMSECSNATAAHHRQRRIHGTIIQTATATGRLTMNDPNLQTIPHPISMTLPLHAAERIGVKPPLGGDVTGEDEITVHLRLREAFVATANTEVEGVDADEWILVSADYCQIEARVLAHFSRDPVLLDVFRVNPHSTEDHTGRKDRNEETGHVNTFHRPAAVDIFNEMAVKIFGKANVTPVERKQAKTLCYAMLYGKGKSSLADDLEIREDEAEEIMSKFRSTYVVAHEFLSAVALQAQQDGFVKTITGRKRWLPYAASPVPKFRAASSRIAVNTLCQGSAADLMKRAMLRIATLPEFSKRDASARLLIQIHDELLLEVKASQSINIARQVSAEMESAALDFSLDVPFPVSISMGKTWADLIELHLE